MFFAYLIISQFSAVPFLQIFPSPHHNTSDSDPFLDALNVTAEIPMSLTLEIILRKMGVSAFPKEAILWAGNFTLFSELTAVESIGVEKGAAWGSPSSPSESYTISYVCCK